MKKSVRKNMKVLAAIFLLHPAIASPVWGQTTVKEAVEKAINTNPEIMARFHAFRDVYEEQGVSRGGYFPKLDASAGVGKQWLSGDNIARTDYMRKGVRLELSQMIYDGFLTTSDVKRLKYSGRARYFEFLDSMENIGLESVRSYADVLRYREMVRLAKQNLDYHNEIFNLVESRVKAGVGAGVDLEQISARVALAQSNYITEQSNLHDVSVRYQRLTGVLPDTSLEPVVIPVEGIPANIADVLNEAYQHSPGYLATMDDITSFRYAMNVKKASFSPRLDVKAYHDWSYDADGIQGKRNDTAVELRLTWNILNGGSDAAAVSQYRERMYRAIDVRNKAAVDLRQILSTAVNDRRMLSQQVAYLEKHRSVLDRVRVSYREQFSISKRTLLDLLDTENEYYQAQRAYFNGYYDLAISKARVLAGMGKLTHALGVTRGELPDIRNLNIPGPEVADKDIPADRLFSNLVPEGQY
ncbi:MAG: TolC family outer membrane protein [Chlorobiaceae bacterium]|nr:TolC family outer membrane protein [Chlorobiaceae bacterium]